MFKSVIDTKGNYIEFVEVDDIGNTVGYTLKEGEVLISDLGFQGMYKPVYRDGRWIETGTPPTPPKVPSNISRVELGDSIILDSEMENTINKTSNGMVEINIGVTRGVGNGIPNGFTIMTLPEDLRPHGFVRVGCCLDYSTPKGSSAGNLTGYAQVVPDGRVMVYTDGGNPGAVHMASISIIYKAKEGI